MRKNTTNLLWGILLIAAGVVMAGNILRLWDISLFFVGWWTLFLIIPGLISMIQNGPNAGNVSLTLIGCLLLMEQQRIVPRGVLFKMLIPILLIVLGFQLLFGNLLRRQEASENNSANVYGADSSAFYGKINNNACPDYIAVFSKNCIKNNAPDLKCGSVSAVLGVAVIDLREARINRDIVFNVSAVLGSVQIMVPKDVRIEMSGIPVLGANTNRVPYFDHAGAFKISFNCISILGSVEIL